MTNHIYDRTTTDYKSTAYSYYYLYILYFRIGTLMSYLDIAVLVPRI